MVCTARINVRDCSRARGSDKNVEGTFFHATWALLNLDAAMRPPGKPTWVEREVESRDRALKIFPGGALFGRIFADAKGRPKTFKVRVYNYSDPYWRVEYLGGDWEQLTEREEGDGTACLLLLLE